VSERSAPAVGRTEEPPQPALPAEIVVLDAAGRVVAANAAWRRAARRRAWLSSGSGSTLGTDFLDVFRRRAAIGAPGATDIVVGIQAILEGRRSGLRLEYRWDDSRETNWFLLSATGVDGGHAGAIVTHRDITARRAAEQDLWRAATATEAADHEKAALLASMSHELRTPLDAIIGFSQLLEERLGGPRSERQRFYVGNILASGHQLLELIDGVLDLTRGENARRSLQVSIARADTAPTERPRLPDPKPAARPLVLVAEDDPQGGEMLWYYLQEAGCAVARAYTGEQALRMAAELQPAVITVDTLLPDRDGLEVLALLKALPATREIAVIVVSVTQPREVAFELGALEWLVKPVSSTVLLDAIRRGCPERVTAPGVGEEGSV
jgi:CheY-like chemotaxis protein